MLMTRTTATILMTRTTGRSTKECPTGARVGPGTSPSALLVLRSTNREDKIRGSCVCVSREDKIRACTILKLCVQGGKQDSRLVRHPTNILFNSNTPISS